MRLKRSKLSEKQSRRLLEHFVAGTPARTAADLAGVNKNSAVLYYHRLREIIAARIEDESPCSGEVEIDDIKGIRMLNGIPKRIRIGGIVACSSDHPRSWLRGKVRRGP